EIIPCTRYTRIISTKSLRVRETPACRPNESPHTRHRTKRHPSTTGRVPLPHILKRSHVLPRGFVVLYNKMSIWCITNRYSLNYISTNTLQTMCCIGLCLQ